MKKNRRQILILFFLFFFGIGQNFGHGNNSPKSHNNGLNDGFSDPLDCIELTTTITDSKDEDLTLWALDFVLNEDAFENILVSLDPAGPFTESFVADCSVDGQNTFPVYLIGIIDQEEFTCETTVTIIDNALPVPIVRNSYILNLENGSATLTPEMINLNSFDNCSDVDVSLSKTSFSASDVGVNTIIISVMDQSGNKSYTYSSILVNDQSSCNLALVQFPEDIDIYDPSGDPNNFYLNNLQSSFGYSFEEVYPYTEAECAEIYYTFQDQVFGVPEGYKAIRKWTALDWLTMDIITHTQILRLFENNYAISCGTDIPISVFKGPRTLSSKDLLIGSAYNYNDMTLVLTDNEENVVVDNVVTVDFLGDTLLYEVTENSTGDSCWGYLIVNNQIYGCTLSNAGLNFPLPEIQIEELVADPTVLTPENLMANYGYQLSDILMTWNNSDCQIIGFTYEDDISENGDGSYTIVRNINVYDWVNYYSDNPTTGMWSFSQTINTASNSSSPNCNDVVNISLNAIGQAVLPAEVFIEGNPQYDVIEVSLDNINFSETANFDCDDVNMSLTVYVHVEQDGNEFNCTSQAMVEDKLAPIVIVNDFTINLESEADTYTLTVNDVENGSFDNCTELTKELSQTEFSSVHWGQNQVQVTVTDVSGNSATASSTVTVLINGISGTLECISDLTTSTEPWGGPELWGVDFVLNSADFDQVLVSLDPSGPFTASFIAPCGVNGSAPTTVYIQATSGTDVSVCSSNLTVLDVTPPVPVAEQTVILSLENGTATLDPAMVDNGSYDSCTDVILSLDQTEFTVDDIGSNTVVMTVTDLNGNENSVFTTVIVDNGSSCTLDFVIYPDDINIFDENGTPQSFTIENLQEIYGYDYNEIYPYTPSDCENIFYGYSDQLITIDYGFKVIRSWTALDWLNEQTEMNVQVLKLLTGYNTTLVCNNLESISIQNGSVTLWPSDVLEGGPYNLDNMILSLEDSEGNIVVDNLITSEYVGQTLTYTVTDTTTASSCFGNVLVEEEISSCALDENDLSFPLATIQVPDSGIDPVILTPKYLHDNYGYEWSEVLPTWPADVCLLVGYSIEDDYFDYGGGIFKIVRNFTIIDWISYDPVTLSGLWTFTQVINVGINPNSLICDYLPRTDDVGDCESGHTLDDDVEWPADLEIEDYRLAPAELVEFSLVDVLDSEPSFYNNPENYSDSYQDLLVELTSTTLTIGRVWTVTHTIYGFTWTYTQTIVVDFSNFENLVTVNTGSNRAMSGVMINDAFTTNMQGVTYLNAGPVNSIEYKDDFLNGLNILDLILIQRHILGLINLDEYGILAADGNLDGAILGSDLLYLQKRILGIELTDFVDWRFYIKDIQSEIMVEPKGAYVGVKAGDVDDSALLEGDDPLEAEEKFKVTDILLNAGETYLIPVFLEKEYNALGVQFRTQLDLDVIDINDITSDYATEGLDFFVTDDGVLTLMFSTIDPIEGVGGINSDPIFTIEFEAKQNSLLSLALDLESHLSYLATTSLDLIILGGEVEDMIGTGINSVELSSLSVYPNPTVDYLYFDLKDVSINGDMEISVYGLDGQKMFSRFNNQSIDVSDLNAGMYYYQVKIDSYTTTGKFMVVK